jgi:ABC-type glycerol-3-phosphate transport system permease component
VIETKNIPRKNYPIKNKSNQKSLFYRIVKRLMKLIQPAHTLNRSLLGDVGIVLTLLIFGIFTAYPMVFIINNAFKPLSEILIFPPKLFVRNATLNNFRDLFQLMAESWIPISRYVFNTIFITVVGTAGHVLLASMAAYPLAKHKFPGSKTLSKVVVYSLMFNGSVTAIPAFVIMTQLGLVDSLWSLILPAFAFSLGLYLMKNFMEQIPTTYIESAYMDGASEYSIFWRIIMPLVKPAWLTLIILSFQTLWGATGGTYIYNEALKPLSFALNQIAGGGIARTGVVAAISLFMMAVPVSVFIVSQSSIIETMAHSGIKE